MKKVAVGLVCFGFAWGAVLAGPVTSHVVPKMVEEINAAFNGTQGAVVSNGGTVTVAESGAGPFKQTVLTFTNLPVVVVGATGVGFGGVKVYDFPLGHLWVLGVTVKDFGTVPGAGVTAGGGGDFGLGTVIVADADLTDATDVDLLASTSTDPLTTPVDAKLAAAAGFDGSSTAKDLCINQLVDDADIAGTVTNKLFGTITVTWVNLSDS